MCLKINGKISLMNEYVPHLLLFLDFFLYKITKFFFEPLTKNNFLFYFMGVFLYTYILVNAIYDLKGIVLLKT